MFSKKLRDPIWQFIAVLVAVISIIFTTLITYNIYFLSQQKKEISITLTTGGELQNFTGGTIAGLSVTYDNKPIQSLSLVTIKFQNTGSKEILVQDFVSPLRVVLPQGSVIANAEATDTSSPNVQPSLVVIDNTITIVPLLLNPGDYFSLQLTVLDAPGGWIFANNVQIEGRVVGVKDIAVNPTYVSTITNPTAEWIAAAVNSNYFLWPMLLITSLILVAEYWLLAYRPTLALPMTPGKFLMYVLVAIVLGMVLKITLDLGWWFFFPDLIARG